MPPKRARRAKTNAQKGQGLTEYGNYDPMFMHDAINFEQRMKRYAKLAIDEHIFKKPDILQTALPPSEEDPLEEIHEKLREQLTKNFDKHGWNSDCFKKELENESLKVHLDFCKENEAYIEENLAAIRKIVEECEIFLMKSNDTVITFLGGILKERKKILNENQRKHKAKIEKRRKESLAEKKKAQTEANSSSSSPSTSELAQRRIQALQKIRELNALRKAQRGDLNMY